eukprot:10573744-Prorocentrum_lima.AAC.1
MNGNPNDYNTAAFGLARHLGWTDMGTIYVSDVVFAVVATFVQLYLEESIPDITLRRHLGISPVTPSTAGQAEGHLLLVKENGVRV